MSRVPNPSCTTAGHENVPAIGIVRLADTGTEHPYCGECIDTLRDGGVDTVVRMWVPDQTMSPLRVRVERCDTVARAFHETYEALAPHFGYTTRSESAVPWDQVPEANKGLMRAVVDSLIERGFIRD